MIWISVKERLPDNIIDVLVYDPFQNQMITAWYVEKDNRWVSGLYEPEDYYQVTVHPTHWMPLPEPPKP